MPSHAMGHTHGGVRGIDRVPQSTSLEGRFGRMFRRLPPAKFSEAALTALATLMGADFGATPTPETDVDNEENQGISAGYTYLGQFIDHDLTFDPASSLMKQDDPDALVDFRTPRFDLDNIYGRGPDDQPFMYSSDGKKLLLGRDISGSDLDSKVKDLARNNPDKGDKRAIIGDPR